MKVAKSHQLLVFRWKHIYKHLNEFFFLRSNCFVLRIKVAAVLHVNTYRLAIIVSISIFDTQRIEFFLSYIIDGVVSRDAKQPGTKSEIFLKLMKATKCFAER